MLHLHTSFLPIAASPLPLPMTPILPSRFLMGVQRMPLSARREFASLLDWSRPQPVELAREGWWVRANQILLEHRAPRKEEIEKMVAEAEFRPRRGMAELLRKLAELDVPVLVVSAGCSDLIEQFLAQHGVLTPNVHVSSNRLIWHEDSGHLVGCEPHPPITSYCKALTHARNADFFVAHASRQTLLVLGDRRSDLQVASGVPHNLLVSVGLYNTASEVGPQIHDAFKPKALAAADVGASGLRAASSVDVEVHADADGSLYAYFEDFDALCVGHAASLQPLVDLLGEWESACRARQEA
mmetsp:Transcript_16201/g.49238  ORF Transcript_16201/g.49238 Transcript_16201/m.49238 type:complete len:298 (+) Transcript_16201:508-1401(+)